MIRCGMLTVVLLFLFGLIWGGTFLWNRLTTDGEEQTFAGASVIEQPETFPKGKPRIMIDAGHGGEDPGMIGIKDLEEKGINLLLMRVSSISSNTSTRQKTPFP